MREFSEQRDIPPQPISKISSDAVAVIDVAMEALSQWGVRIPEKSRLHQARALLSEARSLPNVPLDLHGAAQGLHALEVAYDFRDIASALPNRRVASWRKELEQCLKGELDVGAANRQPLQLQSQYLVIAALHHAGVEMEYPTQPAKKRGKSPEVIAINGTAKYSLEVKRPEQAKNIVHRVSDAAEQITDFGLEGAIIVDLTDAVRSVPVASFDEAARNEVLRLYGQIWVDGDGPHQGFEPIFVAGGFARRAWYVDHGPPPLIKIQTHSSIGRFAMTPNTLRDHHAGWLRAKLHEGMTLLGFAGDPG